MCVTTPSMYLFIHFLFVCVWYMCVYTGMSQGHGTLDIFSIIPYLIYLKQSFTLNLKLDISVQLDAQ